MIAIFLLLVDGSVAFFARNATCHDGAMCGGNEKCCYNNNNGTGPSFCCTSDESCCPDPKYGVVCCETQQTYCCPPMPQFGIPSRCCPRWMVCCTQGRYGCCDPGAVAADAPEVGAATQLYGMLFSSLEPGNGLFSMAIDSTTGDYTGACGRKEFLSGF